MNSANPSALVPPVRSVTVRVDLSAIVHNYQLARRLAGGKAFAVIKANAYGHGAVPVARALSMADAFAVVTLDEAVALREADVMQPVLVLQGPQSVADCAVFHAQDLWPVIHDVQQHHWFVDCAEADHLHAWLKVDTGMGRLGVSPDEAVSLLCSSTHVRWMGVLSHLACADEADNTHTMEQIDRFHQLMESLNADDRLASRYGRLVGSLANSAGILGWPATRTDWARPGLMLYGCNPLDVSTTLSEQLRPAMSVTAPLISVKRLEAGAGVGYAQTWRCPEAMPVGYVGIGYGDGLPRVLDGRAAVRIKDILCPIIGRVSMDSIAVDLRPAPTAKMGDTATLWDGSLAVDAMARAAGTINYEIVTGIRGKRVYDAEPEESTG